MYITINDIIGEKTIDLSYSIWNFSSSMEIAVISMLSENTQYEMTKPLKLKLVDGSEKEVLSKTYMSRELNAFVEGKHIISDLDNDPQIIKTNKLAKVTNMSLNLDELDLECYMDWFSSLICKNYIFKHFVKTVEPTSLKFCMIIELITLHLEYTIAQVKYANFSYAHAQTFVLLNGEMATVSTGFRKLKFWLWLLWTVFYLNQTGF